MQVLQDSEVKIMQGKITIYLILLSINLTSMIVLGNAVLAMTINDRAWTAFCYVEISTRGIGVFVLLLHIQILAAKRSWLFVERDYIAFLESGGFCTEGQIHRYRLHIRPLTAYHPGPLLIIEDPTAYGLGNTTFH